MALPLFGAAVPVGVLEATFMPLFPGSLAGMGGTEGSAIMSAPFAVPLGGGFLSFDYQLASNEIFRSFVMGPPPAPDFFFVSLDGGPPISLAVVGPGMIAVPPNTTFGWDYGPPGPPPRMLSITSPLLAAGMHTITFGVVDVGDTLMSSGLYLDHIEVTAAVPEASAFLFGVAAAAIVVGARRVRRCLTA
jgi:hypothetical protein